jgi:hypothetical protein
MPRLLNKVHKRAGLTNTVEPTIDNILEERHLEFVGEGKRYWDLVRSGKAASVLYPIPMVTVPIHGLLRRSIYLYLKVKLMRHKEHSAE